MTTENQSTTEEALRDKLNDLFENARQNGALAARPLDEKTRDVFIAYPSGIRPERGVYLKDKLIATISDNPIDDSSVTVHDVVYVPGAGHVISEVIVYASKNDDYTDIRHGSELYAVTEFIRERWITQLEALLRLQQEILHRTGTLTKYEDAGFAAYNAHDTERGLLSDALVLYAGKHDQFRHKVGTLSHSLDVRLRKSLEHNRKGVSPHAD